jgi:hypothetical protein
MELPVTFVQPLELVHLAYAVSPPLLGLVWLYLIFGIPASLAVASVGFAATFSTARSASSVRLICAIALFTSLVNAVFAIILTSHASDPASGTLVDRVWGGMLIATIPLSLIGWWRASNSPSNRKDDHDP